MIYNFLFIDNRIEDVAENEIDVEEEEGFLDSIFGDGAQSRIAERVTDWWVVLILLDSEILIGTKNCK